MLKFSTKLSTSTSQDLKECMIAIEDTIDDETNGASTLNNIVADDSIHLRYLSESDVIDVKSLCGEIFPVEYPDFWYNDVATDPALWSMAAVIREKLVGICIAEVKRLNNCNSEDRDILSKSFPANTPVCYILSLGVDKAYRRRGIASILLDQLLAYVKNTSNYGSTGNKACQIKAVYLHVLVSNLDAISFYERRKFKRHARHSGYYSIEGSLYDGYSYVLYMNGGHPAMSLWSISSTANAKHRNFSQHSHSDSDQSAAGPTASTSQSKGTAASQSQHGHQQQQQSSGGQAATNQQLQQNLTFSGALASTGALALSPYQKSLIRNAWKRMNKKGIASNIGSQIFRFMLEKSSDTKRLFQHIAVIEGVFSFGLTPIQSYHHHSGYFIDVLDDAVNCMDDLSELIPKCNEYGMKHVRYVVYGFRPDFWDIFGEAMICAAREWEGWKKHRETLRAWTILVSFIVDRMRQGYEIGLKRQGYLNSISSGPGVPTDEHLAGQLEEPARSTSFSSDCPSSVLTIDIEQQQLHPHLQDQHRTLSLIPRLPSCDRLLTTPSETVTTFDTMRTDSPAGNAHSHEDAGSITPLTDRGAASPAM